MYSLESLFDYKEDWKECPIDKKYTILFEIEKTNEKAVLCVGREQPLGLFYIGQDLVKFKMHKIFSGEGCTPDPAVFAEGL